MSVNLDDDIHACRHKGGLVALKERNRFDRAPHRAGAGLARTGSGRLNLVYDDAVAAVVPR
jgi:hypothetical protein